jgi:hypothetical protein
MQRVAAVQALREAHPERALLGTGGRIPTRLVEAQELLEVVEASAIVPPTRIWVVAS